MSLDEPAVADRYDLVRLLGAGGMGEVFEAVDRKTGRTVALKRLRESVRMPPELAARFSREVMATAQISSPHVVALLDAGIDGERPYLVMEYLEGEAVSQLADRLQIVPCELAVAIAAQVCEGLIAAHAAGIVHRDIKPSNLVLVGTGKTRTVRIVDFGIARIRRGDSEIDMLTELTRTGALVGSPQYMPPEQLRGLKTLDARADLWSLGVVLYRLLSGRLPHVGDSFAELLIRVCSEPAPPLRDHAPWVEPDLAALVHQLLAIDPVDRPASALALAERLATFLPRGREIAASMLIPFQPALPAAATRRPITTDAPLAPTHKPRSWLLPTFAMVAITGVAFTVLRGDDDDAIAPQNVAVPLPPATPPASVPPASVPPVSVPPVSKPPASVPPTPPIQPPRSGASWFASVRRDCADHAVRVLATSPPPSDADGFAIACLALGQRLVEAKARFEQLPATSRAAATGPLLELAVERAAQHNDDLLAASFARGVLQYAPDTVQAAYIAGIVEFQHGHAATKHLELVVRLDRSGLAAIAQRVLAQIAHRDCRLRLTDLYGHAIVTPGC